jgi:hypothetical protein
VGKTERVTELVQHDALRFRLQFHGGVLVQGAAPETAVHDAGRIFEVRVELDADELVLRIGRTRCPTGET